MADDQLKQTVLSSCHQNFPAKVVHWPRTGPWWNTELNAL